MMDEHGGITLDDGSYVPAVSEVDIMIIVLGLAFLLVGLPLTMYLTLEFYK